MSNITVLGIDLAKDVFQLHGVNEYGKPILKKKGNYSGTFGALWFFLIKLCFFIPILVWIVNRIKLNGKGTTRLAEITEVFHRKMKLIQRRAYGFRNFENYRTRVTVLCC